VVLTNAGFVATGAGVAATGAGVAAAGVEGSVGLTSLQLHGVCSRPGSFESTPGVQLLLHEAHCEFFS